MTTIAIGLPDGCPLAIRPAKSSPGAVIGRFIAPRVLAMRMDTITKQAIGFGIGMALIFGVGSHQVGLGILFGLALGVGFYAYRKRKSAG